MPASDRAGRFIAAGREKRCSPTSARTNRSACSPQPLVPLTPNTITDRLELVREIRRIRQRGYSIDNEEVVLGVHCVGMPILDRSGRAVGGISITGPARKVPGPALDDLVAKLSDACGHVSRRLGLQRRLAPDRTAGRGGAAAAGRRVSGDGGEKTRRVRRIASA